ncbi:MAG: 1,4-dihydroxy-2-naphthoate octaprenyltransferase [Clostridium sp.]|nr:1,4-dihydroxy-2-naphthoate octaprenyltransferase [Clostridium sp.]
MTNDNNLPHDSRPLSGSHPAPVRAWIEAMRLRTLPVSVAGVLLASGYAVAYGCFCWVPALLCLLFAVTAQIASNFANEYYDFRAGLDRPGRIGPRRGVTEGDITPAEMRNATFITLAVACAIGSLLILFGGWWLIFAGAVIALGVFAYSAGPFPLSRHGLGEVAVMLFFGIIPVNLTFYLQSGGWNLWVALASVGLGLMISNVLIVNNYRDRDDDKAVGKKTLAVILGRRAMSGCYLTNGYFGAALMAHTWWSFGIATWFVPALYLVVHSVLWWRLTSLRPEKLNPLLGMTAVNVLLYTLLFFVVTFVLS